MPFNDAPFSVIDFTKPITLPIFKPPPGLLPPAPDPIEPIRNTIELDGRELSRGLKPIVNDLPNIIREEIEQAESIENGITAEINQTVNVDLKPVVDALKRLEKQFASEVEDKAQTAGRAVEHIIQIGNEAIRTKASPVLQSLDLITGGALSISDLPAAGALAIITSIDKSLEFLQTSRLAEVSAGIDNVVESTLAGAGAVTKAVADSADGMVDALLKKIDEAIEAIKATLLDPIAQLLLRIIKAIDDLPEKAALATFKAILTEAPPELVG